MSETRDKILSLDKKFVRLTLKKLKNGYPGQYPASKTNSIGCFLCQKARNKGKNKGWIKTKLIGSGEKDEYYIHYLALIRANRSQELENMTKDHQVSHLCHNPRCFNEKHLIVEHKKSNLERNKCKNWTWVSAPCCGKKFNPCLHNPQCILPKN